MKRQQEGMRSLVYAYGAEVPLDNPHLKEEVQLQRAMWDQLVQLDRDHDRRVDNIMKDTMPEYRQAVDQLIQSAQQLRELKEQRNAERVLNRSKITSLDDDIKAAYRHRDQCRRKVWDLAKQWRKQNPEQVKTLNRERNEHIGHIRRNSGLYWGNYNRVIDSYDAARKACMLKGRRVQPSDPLRDDGVLTVQIQKVKDQLGASAAQLHNGDFRQVQITPVSPAAQQLPARQRSKACYTPARLRVNKHGDLLDFMVYLHRPLPEDGRIKKAQLSWRREGERIRARLCLTVSAPQQDIEHPARIAAGIDLGWRRMSDGSLRVAAYQSTGGAVKYLNLPADWMSGMDQVERLHQHIDDDLLAIAAWIKEHASELPEAYTAPVANWTPQRGSRWVNAAALHNAVQAQGRRSAPEALGKWYARYRHLLLWRDNLRGKLQRRRREIYRLFARELCSQNAILAMEQLNLSDMARTKRRDNAKENTLHDKARANRVRAALHSLQQEIRHQATQHGTRIVHATDYTTRTCSHCGGVVNPEDTAAVKWTCEHCLTTWDRDANAARNLLAFAEGSANAQELDAPANSQSDTYTSLKRRQRKRSQNEYNDEVMPTV